jgi:hypothetical protein
VALDPPSSAEAGDPRAHRGRCHCGALSFTFWTARPLRPRACQCSFCRKHSARTVSDAEGKATIHLAVPLDSAAYRFASRQADYLVCPGCGVYIGALIPTPGGSFATLNLNAFEKPHPELAAEPVSYDAQSAEEKLARRMGMWTPTTVVGPASGAG